MDKLKLAVFGCGFWSQFQIGGWSEIAEVEIVALYNRTISKATKMGEMFGIKKCYDDARQLLLNHPDIDFVDIITDVDTHPYFVELAASQKKNVICQKPIAT